MALLLTAGVAYFIYTNFEIGAEWAYAIFTPPIPYIILLLNIAFTYI
jgi:hypothetical protein